MNSEVVAVPNAIEQGTSMRQLLGLLLRYRQLIWELVRIELRDRYAGQVFGVLWAILHPILLMGVYVLVFAYLLPARLGAEGEVSRTIVTYILAGLIPWLTFADLLGKASTTIVYNRAFVKQVRFPIEVLPVKAVLASFVSQLVSTSLLLVYIVVVEEDWPFTVLLLPVLFAFQVTAMVGLGYFLSSGGVYFRDLKDFIQVFVTVGLFVAPILYVPNWLDNMHAAFGLVLYLNPFSHFVWCYQDILYFGRIAHPDSWVIMALLSLSILMVGYRVFGRLKRSFGELL